MIIIQNVQVRGKVGTHIGPPPFWATRTVMADENEADMGHSDEIAQAFTPKEDKGYRTSKKGKQLWKTKARAWIKLVTAWKKVGRAVLMTQQ